MKVNPSTGVSDKAGMLAMNPSSSKQPAAGRAPCPRAALVAGLILLLSLGSVLAQAPADGEEDEVAPDLNALKGRAEAGQAKAQTQLADMLAGSGDFTNAVSWYRKAAEQGDVPAQLTLATLLVTGRGAAKDPAEAARWLRAAADRIEGVKPTAPKYPTNAIVITRSNLPPATNLVAVTTPPPVTNLSRVPRAATLHTVEPTLQDVRPALRPPTELR